MENADILNLGMLLVTAIATVVAVISVVDARRSRSEAASEAKRAESAATRAAEASERIHEAMLDSAETERLVRRMDFARDLMVWLEKSTAVMVIGPEGAVLQRDWVDQGERLNATARTLDSEGGHNLLVAAREARAGIAQMPVERRLTAAMSMTRLLKLWVEQWVRDPSPVEYPVAQWIGETAAVDAVADALQGAAEAD